MAKLPETLPELIHFPLSASLSMFWFPSRVPRGAFLPLLRAVRYCRNDYKNAWTNSQHNVCQLLSQMEQLDAY